MYITIGSFVLTFVGHEKDHFIYVYTEKQTNPYFLNKIKVHAVVL